MRGFFKLLLIIAGIFFVFSLPVFSQVDENLRNNLKKAFTAGTPDECKVSLEICYRALKVVPFQPVLNYLAARLNALMGNDDKAMVFLKKATELGYTTKLPFNKIHHLNDPAFITLRKNKKFGEVIELLKKSERQIHRSQIAFSVKDKKLGTEGITYDPVEKMFYMGSIFKHKIVKVDSAGINTDFTKESQDGLSTVLGMHVDPSRRILWVCSENKKTTGVYKYDLLTGKLIKKYLKPFDRATSFNDLVIHPEGDVYITNARRGEIYFIPSSRDKLELFLKSKSIVSPNGITLSEDGKAIYFADYPLGIFKVDIETKSFNLLSQEPGFSTCTIDGLYFANEKLYAIQIGLNQVSRFSLDKGATHIKNIEIFERYTPGLIDPTTGVIVDDYFYYITDDGGSGDNPKGIVVMKAYLK